MASNREFSSTDASHGLSGFSSNSHWAEDAQDEGGYWSHHPVHLGPKEGFRDPAQVEPAREQLPVDIKEV